MSPSWSARIVPSNCASAGCGSWGRAGADAGQVLRPNLVMAGELTERALARIHKIV
jgi:hypothetical protein